MNKEKATTPLEYGFIITKPLQLMVVMAIIEQLPAEIGKELIIVDAFFGAKKIAEKLITSNPKWQSAVFCQNPSSAFKYCRKRQYDSVFLDSDVGFSKNIDLFRLKLSNFKTNIVVYEEGLGSYRTNLYYGPKKLIFSLLGIGVRFGGNWLTSKIYLFQPSEYTNKFRVKVENVIQIKTNISQIIQKYNCEFDKLFELTELKSNLSGKFFDCNCGIYLTSWNLNSDAMSWLRNGKFCRVIKIHPHIKKLDAYVAEQFDAFVSPTIPAEVLITIASDLFERVRVLHHGSSVVRYINIKNVQFEMLDNTKTAIVQES